MFYQSIQPFLEPIFSWLCCPDNCSQQIFTPLPPVFSFQDAIYNPNVYLLLSLSSLIGLALSSFLMDYSLYSLSQSAPGSNSIAVFNILLFRLKPEFLRLQNLSAISLFISTCFSLDLVALGDLYEAFNIAWTSQQVMFPQAQIMLAALVVFCSFVGTALFHKMLCSALHLVKVKGNDFKPRAIVLTILCDLLNLVTLACFIIHVLYLGASIQLI
jgi:hypothetical protein